MKRTINIKALLSIIAIPIVFFLVWLIGVVIWDIWGKNNPSLWLEIHNQPFLNNLTNGALILLLLAMGGVIIILIGYGLNYIFNWIFPKNLSPDKPNRDGE